MMEAVVSLAVVVKKFNFSLVPDQDIGMTTGATIHTTNGTLYDNAAAAISSIWSASAGIGKIAMSSRLLHWQQQDDSGDQMRLEARPKA